MSLYGALFSGVSGLKSQGNKIGIISDNISNINTVGYKAGQAQFETLVTSTANTTLYSPGGVLGSNRQLVDKQGLLLSTDAPTDIAISGAGFFVVRAQDSTSSQPLYTRAGSFRQDELGNFVNAAGFYLQGWPLDGEGRLPGEPGNLNAVSSANLDSLQTVNVESASGVAAATTTVNLGINLDAGEDIYPGQGIAIPMLSTNANNATIDSQDIIVGNDFGAAATSGIRRGDAIQAVTGAGLTYTYTYGGYVIGRDVTTAGAGNVGDGAVDTSPDSIANSIATDGATTTVTVTLAGHGYVTGQTVTIANVTTMGLDTIPLGEINGQHVITVTGVNTFTFTTTTASTAAEAATGGAGATVTNRPFSGNIMDATSASQTFLGTTGVSGFTTASRSFTITTPTTGTVTFTYTTSSPNASLGQFNTMTNLASAIDSVVGLTARVVSGRLYVGPEDASESMTFANGDATGAGGLQGIDWVTELDLVNQTAAAASANRFSTMANLQTLVNNSDGLGTTLTSPLSDSTLTIRVDDPLDTIQLRDFVPTTTTAIPNNALTVPATAASAPAAIVVTDAAHTFTAADVGRTVIVSGLTAGAGGLPGTLPNGTFTLTAVNPGVDYTFTIPGSQITAVVAGGAGVGGAAGTIALANAGSLLTEFGITNSDGSALNGSAAALSTDVEGPQYDATNVTKNMASGSITPQFSRNVRVYDALGAGHEVRLSFIKTALNTWAVEVHAIPETDVSATYPDGQVAYGTITFNGDGSLNSVSSSLTNAITIAWENGSLTSGITFNWGTAGLPAGTSGATSIGLTDGMSQFDSDYKVAFVNQNGSQVGELISVTIDEQGFVIASYSNGETQNLYKLALADFANPNGLKTLTGNVFAETQDSGDVNLREPGTSGTGTIASSTLESSNVELSEQLTDMIVAQRAYQSNTRVISVTDSLLEELNQLTR